MSDVTELQAAQAVEITDTDGNSAAKINSALPSTSDPGLTVREVRQGQQPMSSSVPVVIASDQSSMPVTSFGNLAVRFGDSPSIDAFDRLRVSEPHTIFDSNVVQTDQALLWTQSLTGSATITRIAAEASMRLRCTTASGDVAIRQTKSYMSYQSGKSMLVMITGLLGAIKTNVTQRIGYFDNDNGIFFEQNGTNLRVVLRTNTSGSPVDTAVNQASWNLDPLDGTGTSGITLDTSKVQIFIIDFGWLGVGRVRIGLQIGGTIYYCHQFLTSNIGTLVYMATPSLPIRYEIRNTGTAASNTDLYAICCSAVSEGGYNTLGIVRGVDTGSTTPKSVGTTLIPLISMRLKSANNRSSIQILGCNVWVTNSSDVRFVLMLNSTLTGASFTSVSANSIAEYDISATTLSGGENLFSGYAGNSGSQIPYYQPLNVLNLNSDFSGTADIITLAAVRMLTSDANTFAGLTFREIF